MRSKKGFTLIELAVVMAIIAVLALLVIGAIIAARNAQKRTVHRGNGATAQTALEAMYTRNQQYPTIAAGTTIVSAFATGGALNGNGTPNTSGTTCANGGVTLTSAANAYTISVVDIDCSTVIQTITN